jgi:hypothetical protein
MVENSTVLGVKDAQKSLFEIWREILQVPSSKKLVELSNRTELQIYIF